MKNKEMYIKPIANLFFIREEESIAAGSVLNFGGDVNGNPQIELTEESEEQELYF